MDNEMCCELMEDVSKQISTIVTYDSIIALGSGPFIRFLVTEFTRRAAEIKKKRIQFHCTKTWVQEALAAHGIIAFQYENASQIPRIDYYFESPDVVCELDDPKKPIFIKSDFECRFSGMLMKKSRCVYLVTTGTHVTAQNIRGIPMELSNGIQGLDFMHLWVKEKGGLIRFRKNAIRESDRIYVEWVPYPVGKANMLLKNVSWPSIQLELNSISGVLAHNLFALPNCRLLESCAHFVEEDYKPLFDKKWATGRKI